MSSQVACEDLRVAGRDGGDQCVVDEHILVLGLHHVVALSSHARHVAVHVQRRHVRDALQHRVHRYERSRSTHASATHTHTHTHTHLCPSVCLSVVEIAGVCCLIFENLKMLKF